MTDEPTGEVFDAQVLDHHGVTVLAVAGELGLIAARKFADLLYSVATQSESGLVVDMTNVVFLSSSAVSVLVRASEMMPNGSPMVLVAAHPAVQRPIVLSGLDRVITTLADRAHAVAEVIDSPSVPPRP